jgi:hypothetical protein
VEVSAENRLAATFVSAVPMHLLNLEAALLANGVQSDVKRGENSGRKLQHDFVAVSFGKASMTGEGVRWSANLTLGNSREAKPTGLAVWVANERGEPIQATGGWISP